MINLIPNTEKKAMKRGFYARLVVLLLTLLATSIFLALIALLPAYFASSMKINLVDKKLGMQRDEPVPTPDQETLSIIRSIDQKLNIIEASIKGKKFLVSERVIDAIVAKKMSDIKITDITFDNDKKLGRKINIQGTAPSRERLLLFREALEQDPSFKSVNLPISNFVKGTNIQFYLSLIPS